MTMPAWESIPEDEIRRRRAIGRCQSCAERVHDCEGGACNCASIRCGSARAARARAVHRRVIADERVIGVEVWTVPEPTPEPILEPEPEPKRRVADRAPADVWIGCAACGRRFPARNVVEDKEFGIWACPHCGEEI